MVKEVKTLYNAGYRVSVIYCPISAWADPFDEALFQEYPHVKWICAGSHVHKQPLKYFYARLRRKWYWWAAKYVGAIMNIEERALVLFSQELSTKACTVKADLYIGHNLGALPAVVKASQKYKAQSCFDFEDYHRGEYHDQAFETRLVKTVEERFAPKLSMATAASPLITEAYMKHFPNLNLQTINNCFPLAYALPKIAVKSNTPLKLFWFSQHLGPNRGLEHVISAMGLIPDTHVELTLLASCSAELKNYFTELAKNAGLSSERIKFMEPVNEHKIVALAASCHIGLALDPPLVENRERSLTNKIFMYLLAGNAILFSHTKAHHRFLDEYGNNGFMVESGKIEALAEILKTYQSQPELLSEHQTKSMEIAQKLNWENEKIKLLCLIKEALHA
jgi:glycosyltransferase involved in cell wall biosynthesis